jgi:hypothetical protein
MDDQNAESKRKGDGQLDRLRVSRMTPADHKELSKLLGIEPGEVPLPPPMGPLGVDVRKPLSTETGDEILQILRGQRRPRPGPEAAPPPVKPTDRLVLVLAYNPVRPTPATSKEVKLFLEHRGQEPRAGMMQVILVLRGSNS